MNPQKVFCPNHACPARGKAGEGNITIHSRKDRRYRCRCCRKTFTHTYGTAVYGLKHAHDLFMLVVTLLAYGCPVQAIVVAFVLDERTVRDWLQRAGQHSQAVHEGLVLAEARDLQQVQADEIKAKSQAGPLWLALALEVRTRLWLGGAVSPRRDLALIQSVVASIRRAALPRPLLLAVDGLSSYVTAFQQAFRAPLPRHGACGRPRLVAWPDIAIIQVVKRRLEAGLEIERRIVQGCPQMIAGLLAASQGGGVFNTAYIERLNATFRQRLACLARRSRALCRLPQTLQAAMFLVGTVYNFCSPHQSLRVALLVGRRGRRHWVQRTPAMAAGLTDHVWSVEELMTYKLPPPPWVPPKRRGRPPKAPVLDAAA